MDVKTGERSRDSNLCENMGIDLENYTNEFKTILKQYLHGILFLINKPQIFSWTLLWCEELPAAFLYALEEN